MKKNILFLCLLISVLSLSAQDITSVFLSIPDDIFLGLNSESKNDLIAESNDTVEVKATSLFGGEIIRQEFSNDLVAFQTSTSGILQIKLLSLINNSKIIAVVKTVCGRACDSNIRFYTTDWELLPKSSFFPKLDINWFLKQDADFNSESFKNAYAALDMIPIKIEFNPNNLQVNLYLDAETYLSEEEYENIKPYLTEKPYVLTWDKASFK